jgi:hypothetical protein
MVAGGAQHCGGAPQRAAVNLEKDRLQIGFRAADPVDFVVAMQVVQLRFTSGVLIAFLLGLFIYLRRRVWFGSHDDHPLNPPARANAR